MERARRMNLIALALLITALIAYIAFHFLPLEVYPPDLYGIEPDRGYEVWGEVVEFAKDPSANDPQDMIALAGFLCAAFLIIVSPFLVPLLHRSRWMWWTVVLVSGATLCGLGGVLLLIFFHDGEAIPGSGIHCLLAALALNFLGLLFIRREKSPLESESFAPPPVV
ncbi:hypothetical protein [Luteolibacter rhizosphaerae]|nr:hypothetical protein [Luteolibacter rhizosphaerae]